MINWLIFLALVANHGLAVRLLVPEAHRLNYRRFALSHESLIANALWFGAVAACAAQQFIRPVEAYWQLTVLGAVLYAVGAFFVTAAFRTNPYFVPAVVAPPAIIREGIYAWVGHPGYVGMVLCLKGIVLVLGQPSGDVFFILYTLFIVRQINREEELLWRSWTS